jgi:hypothetical protein
MRHGKDVTVRLQVAPGSGWVEQGAASPPARSSAIGFLAPSARPVGRAASPESALPAR